MAGAVPVLAWPAARRAARRAAAALPAQLRPLSGCGGAVLAEDLLARSALPPFDVSAMDGFAVAGAGPWRVVGEVLAGGAWAQPLSASTAVRIGTGAPVPRGAAAVLPVEHAELHGDVVHGVVEPDRHIRRAGEECRPGDLLVSAGTPIGAAVLGLAAATGHDQLRVCPRPRVVGLVTGDELLQAGVPSGAQVRDALGPQLPLLVAAHGGDLVGQRHVPDDDALLRAAIGAADAEVVVTTGASSSGPADHLRAVVGGLGGEVLVDGVACRPGHPQLLARLPDGRLVVGLPGNPLAALVAAATLLGPVLAGLGGRAERAEAALLAQSVPASARDTRLVPVAVAGLRATPVPYAGAAMLRGAAVADALVVVPPGRDLAAGAEVELLRLP